MKKSIGVVVYGGTGYGAGELLRLLSVHPHAEVAVVVSSSRAGSLVCDTHRFLGKISTLAFVGELDFSVFDGYETGVIVASLPHGASAKTISGLVPEADKRGLKIIDLSGDFRLHDALEHKKHYGEDAVSKELRTRFVYGLPELFRNELRQAQFVSNPGCLATACILAGLVLVKAGVVSSLVCDAKTGTSGAGRTPKSEFHHPECHGNTFAYKVLEHRHEPEIVQTLSDFAKKRMELCFVPHVVPVSRGIYATVYGRTETEISVELFKEAAETLYGEAPFVRLLSSPPRLVDVVGSNFADLSVSVRGQTVVAIVALDNLIKGMVGQAVQNMNLMCGIEETTGLWSSGPGLI
jgi:N-acetyl-gamma-glutamyl-phosphate reductase